MSDESKQPTAVFYDTGGGDIYAGPTREAVIKAMLHDNPESDLDQIEELDGNNLIQIDDENEEFTGEFTTLAELHGSSTDAYCIGSTNC
jgi:hypothetical protein